jgi:hypothetical protein
MVETYRKAIGSTVWHFCSNCSTWPADDYIASLSPQQIGREALCTECVARHDVGDCENYEDAEASPPRKCPVIQSGKECGRDLRPELTAGIHICVAGHRILIVPPRRSKD